MFKRRWPDGFVCPACGKRRFAALKSRPRLYECLDCGRQTSVTAGTAMHRSRLPLTTWFWAAHLMTTHSNGMSALQLQDQLGVTYKTAWLLTQKLRRSMFDPDREPLEGVVEIDQTEIPFREGDTFFESGNAGKILVIGAVEVIERDTNKAKPRRKHAKYLDTRSGRIRLAMIADNSAASIEAFVNANVKRGDHAAHRWPQILSGPERLSARSARRRQDGRAHCSAVDSSGVFADEAMEPRHVSRIAPQARRYISQRVRVSLQSPILPARFIRNPAGTRRPQRARELLGPHQARQSEERRGSAAPHYI